MQKWPAVRNSNRPSSSKPTGGSSSSSSAGSACATLQAKLILAQERLKAAAIAAKAQSVQMHRASAESATALSRAKTQLHAATTERDSFRLQTDACQAARKKLSDQLRDLQRTRCPAPPGGPQQRRHSSRDGGNAAYAPPLPMPLLDGRNLRQQMAAYPPGSPPSNKNAAVYEQLRQQVNVLLEDRARLRAENDRLGSQLSQSHERANLLQEALSQQSASEAFANWRSQRRGRGRARSARAT